MGERYVLELREPGHDARRVAVDSALVVGRECEGITVDDATVSRRHVMFEVGPGSLVATDLASRNGTRVNGTLIDGSVAVELGDTVRIGDVDLTLVEVPGRAGPPRVLRELEARAVDGAVIRFRPGTPGERAAGDMATSVRRAAKRLAGLGVDLKTLAPQICLVDPFPDPGAPGQVLGAGSVVDVERREIWMVVTAEAPPEPIERPLALLLGATLPGGGGEIATLLEGYGLAVAGLASPDPQLRTIDLPSLDDAEGDLRSAMAQSFVTFLLARAERAEFLRMLAMAGERGLTAAAHDVYGQDLTALEETWALSLGSPTPKVKAGQFLRLTARYLRPHLAREIEISVYMLFALAFTTVFPFGMRRLIDSAIPNKDFGQVMTILGVLGVAFVVSLVAGVRRAYLSAVVSSAVTRDLRVDMFTRLQRLSSGWFSRQQEGDILSRLFSDVAQLEGSLSGTIREGVFQVLTLAVSAVVLLTLSPLLGAIIILGAPLVGIVYRLMASGAQKRSLAVQEEMGTTFTVASENYAAQPIVKAFALETREEERFARSSERLFGREVKLQLFGGLFGLSVNMIVTVLQLTVLALGSWLILHGHLSIGGLVAFSAVMGQVLSPVTVLTGLGQQIQAATGSLLRINEVVDTEPEIDDDESAIDLPRLGENIAIEGVQFSYTGERPTLEDVDCTIPAGSRVAFVGPTGAGKSSVLQLIMRFYDVDDGVVRFDGHDVRDVTVASLRGQIGVVFQDTFLFDTTIRENIALGRPGATDAEVEAAARAAELHEFIETLPRGYNTLVGERGGRLSGGQRQRIAIARALLRDPRVLLLDEATSALDPRTERLISATLDRVGAGRTTIAVTHRLTSITGYDQIFVMSSGRLVERGLHTDLLALGGVYAELWAEQTGTGPTEETALDVVAALRAVHLFSDLSRDELASVAGALREYELPPGARLMEETGALTIVRRGRPRVLAPSYDGRLAPTVTLEPGDAFGVSALHGAATGAVLVADEPLAVLVLGADELREVAAEFPTVAAALAGEGREDAPAGGARLSRSSMVLRQSRVLPAVAPSVDAPSPDAVRRMSGAFPAVRS